MVKRMLIDATHPEETRIVVAEGNRLDEFDYETSTKRQIKGNIYLAKVTRVEPSLQAAFVEYGGNRHGFLSFSEIHPDYYRIPVSDRPPEPEPPADDDSGPEDDGNGAAGPTGAALEAAGGEIAAEDDDEEDGRNRPRKAKGADVESLGGDEMEEEIEEIRPTRARRARRYKIQEVVKRRQILLVQVTKEERGTKGAALTTYISLAGRYCVLMPNTARGGGISRKISGQTERKRMKKIMDELKIPEGIAVILRTAGVARSKAEIRRDYEYLLKTWDGIRQHTLESTAPALIHEEGDIVKRSIRDLYSNEISEILVEGEEGYRTAKEFMRTLIPSHAKHVKRYREEAMPLFHRYKIESQIDNIHSPVVRLKSGGYIVIDSTEALVAIDVNSGRATRERNIEETAYRTNLEAAEEVARQLRLRDLAGLIVIDFIDMEEQRHNTAVERRLKDSMQVDRARIQLGRISAFGLLEMSRQRLRPSLIEASTQRCRMCDGTGVIRSIESTALHVLRHLEDEGIRNRGTAIEAFVPTAVAFYLLNQKRAALGEVEQRYGMTVRISGDEELIPPDMRIEQIGTGEGGGAPAPAAGPVAWQEAGEEAGRTRPKRRRRKTAGDDTEAPPSEQAAEAAGAEAAGGEAAGAEEDGAGEDRPENGEEKPRRRRRGRRGGRRRSRRGTRREEIAATAGDGTAGEDATAAGPDDGAIAEAGESVPADGGEKTGADDATAAEPEAAKEATSEAAKGATSEATAETAAEAEAKPARRRPARRTRKAAGDDGRKTAGDEGEKDGKPKARKPARRRAKKAEPEVADATPEVADTTPDAEPEIAGKAAKGKAGNGGGRRADTPAGETAAGETAAGKDAGKTPVDDGGGEAAPEAAAPDSAKPKRKGWWRGMIDQG